MICLETVFLTIPAARKKKPCIHWKRSEMLGERLTKPYQVARKFSLSQIHLHIIFVVKKKTISEGWQKNLEGVCNPQTSEQCSFCKINILVLL